MLRVRRRDRDNRLGQDRIRSISVQALSVHLLAGGALRPGLHRFPDELDREIARTKLATLGLELGEPTARQREFEARWSV